MENEQLETEVLTPEQQLAALRTEHEAMKQQLAETELKNKVTAFTGEAFDQIVKNAAERHIKFPGASPEALDELTPEDMLVGRHIMSDRIARGIDSGYNLQDRLDAAMRTMTTGGTATGAELLESPMLAKLWQDLKLKAKVANLFTPHIDMPGKTLDLPLGLGDVNFYKPGGEGQSVAATNLGTAKRTLTAYPLKCQVDISDELDQDSVIAILPQIRAALTRRGAEVLDKVILKGDTEAGATGNINSDDAAPGGTEDYLLGFDGLIKYALVTNSGQSSDLGALAVADFGTLMGLLQKYAVDFERLAWISGWYTYLFAVTMSDFRTVDKLGAKATLLTGQVGAVYNIPYICSGEMEKVDDDGKYTTTSPSSNDTDGRLLLVHRDMWRVGVRKPFRIATERSEAKGQTSLVGTMRIALNSYDAAGVHTAIGYNVTTPA